MKIPVERARDEIVGGTIVASHAGELIPQITLAIQHRLGLGAFTHLVYPFPTQGEALKAAAGEYTRTRLTAFAKRLTSGLMRLRR